MGLTAGIVGLPNVGKSTLFNAITRANVLSANYPFATIEPNVGVVTVDDERLRKIADIINPQRVIYADFAFTDIAGLVKGASQGEGLGNQFLSQIREVDAIVQVVRCFDSDDIIHVTGKIDPISDIETINLELIFADLEIVERRIPRIEKKAQLKVDNESVVEYRALTKVRDALANEINARDVDLSPAEQAALRGYNLLTIKPMILCLNVDEDGILTDNEYTKVVKEYAADNNLETVTICAKLEEELSTLEDEDRELFLADLGIKESGLEQLTKRTFSLLNLATFFTFKEIEVRAWTFKKGMNAQSCAGIIHTDFARGFIRAEVTSYDDFMKAGSRVLAREQGLTRLEGKDYKVLDGDIILFRFNI